MSEANTVTIRCRGHSYYITGFDSRGRRNRPLMIGLALRGWIENPELDFHRTDASEALDMLVSVGVLRKIRSLGVGTCIIHDRYFAVVYDEDTEVAITQIGAFQTEYEALEAGRNWIAEHTEYNTGEL